MKPLSDPGIEPVTIAPQSYALRLDHHFLIVVKLFNFFKVMGLNVNK